MLFYDNNNLEDDLMFPALPYSTLHIYIYIYTGEGWALELKLVA